MCGFRSPNDDDDEDIDDDDGRNSSSSGGMEIKVSIFYYETLRK